MNEILAAAAASWLLGSLAGYFIGLAVADIKWQTLLIKRGQAQYNKETGAWEWGRTP